MLSQISLRLDLKRRLQPTSDKTSNQVAVDKILIGINDQQHWLYAANNPNINELLHLRLFSTTTTALAEIFFQELRNKHTVNDALLLVNDAPHLKKALRRAGLRFRVDRHGIRSAIERILYEPKRRTPPFSNCFSYIEPITAET